MIVQVHRKGQKSGGSEKSCPSLGQEFLCGRVFSVSGKAKYITCITCCSFVSQSVVVYMLECHSVWCRDAIHSGTTVPAARVYCQASGVSQYTAPGETRSLQCEYTRPRAGQALPLHSRGLTRHTTVCIRTRPGLVIPHPEITARRVTDLALDPSLYLYRGPLSLALAF